MTSRFSEDFDSSGLSFIDYSEGWVKAGDLDPPGILDIVSGIERLINRDFLAGFILGGFLFSIYQKFF